MRRSETHDWLFCDECGKKAEVQSWENIPRGWLRVDLLIGNSTWHPEEKRLDLCGWGCLSEICARGGEAK